MSQWTLYSSQLQLNHTQQKPMQSINLWGHPHCKSPSSIQFSARQHDNTLSLPLSNPSLSVTRVHSQLQTKCSFPSQHLNTSIHSTTYTYVICQWQGRSTAWSLYKNGHVSSQVIQRLHQEGGTSRRTSHPQLQEVLASSIIKNNWSVDQHQEGPVCRAAC